MPGVNGGSGFTLPPQLSMTSFHGGHGCSTTPDQCQLNVAVRTTPAFDAHDAETLIHKTIAELDAELPAPKPTEITPVASRPPLPPPGKRRARSHAAEYRR